MDIEILKTKFSQSERNKHWNISHETGVFLVEFIKNHAITHVLEIGTSNGVSTCYLSLALQDNGGTITTIESNIGRRAQALQNFKTLHLNNIVSLHGHAPQALELLDDTFDLIFIDCIKLYYKPIFEYIITSWQKPRFIIADNTISHADKLQDFFALLNKHQIESIPHGGGQIIIKL